LKLGEVAVNPFGEDDDDFAGDLLNLFELDQHNPTKESIELTGLTLVCK